MSDKIVLIYGDTQNYGANLLPPLSLVYVGTRLRHDFAIRIIDQRIEDDWEQRLRGELKQAAVLCVGISAMTGPQISGGIRAATIVREVSAGTPIIWGGVHPSLLPEQTIQSELVDMIVVGDGEETFEELAHALRDAGELTGIRGLVYKQDGVVVKNAVRGQFPLKQLGLPAYDLIEAEKYIANPAWTGRPSLPIVTSRGCPYRCGYCYNTEFSQKRWTALTPEQTLELIEDLVSRYRLEGVFLLDDNFFVDLQRVRRICELLREKELGLHIYNGNCRADAVDRMDDEFLRLLKEAGFEQLFIGIESGSDKVLEAIHKDITVEQVLAINRRLKAAGIRPFYSFMAGFPFETLEDVKETLGLMNRLLAENPESIVYRLQLYTPFPGTELYAAAQENGARFSQSLQEWARYHYDEIHHDGFEKKHRSFLKDFHYYTTYLDRKISADRTWYLRAVSNLYSDLLRFRLSHDWYSGRLELVPLRWGQKVRDRILGRC